MSKSPDDGASPSSAPDVSASAVRAETDPGLGSQADAPAATDDASPATPDPEKRFTTIAFGGQIFVRGGGNVFTLAHEQAAHEQYLDAERRRDEADADRRVAQTPIEQGGARLFNAAAGGGNTDIQQAYVLLTFVDRRGDPLRVAGKIDQCLADLFWISPEERHLQIVCPQCIEKGVHQDQAQLRISNLNRGWHLDERTAGTPFKFNDGYVVKTYRSAGMIVDGEPFECPRCAWRALIDKNKVWRV